MRARSWVPWLVLAVLFLNACSMFEPGPAWRCARNPCGDPADSLEVPRPN